MPRISFFREITISRRDCSSILQKLPASVVFVRRFGRTATQGARRYRSAREASKSSSMILRESLPSCPSRAPERCPSPRAMRIFDHVYSDPRKGAAADGRRLEGLKVLVVEDHEDSRDLLAELLRFYGAEVLSAESASHAMALFSAFRPQVLVSNIGMPDTDGCTLMDWVRGEDPAVTAVAVTGYVRPIDMARIEAAGFRGFLAKPIDPATLSRCIHELVHDT
ncbi:response regulator [bacterium]|nr:MAG: response regulator [bacterium]